MRGLLKLTWVEIKIFLREPMGVLGTIGIPIVVFVLLGRTTARGPGEAADAPAFLGRGGLPIFASVFVAVGAVLSLIAIISIYREGGILKRLRATPLRPQTILTAHVLVKLLFTGVTIVLFVAAGRRFFPLEPPARPLSFALAMAFATLSILAVGFVIASIVPTARFAQPIGSALLYPLLAVSGLFFSIDVLPAAWRAVALVSPLTHAVSLLRGIWAGNGWGSHLLDVAALVVNFVVCIVVSSRVFRWE